MMNHLCNRFRFRLPLSSRGFSSSWDLTNRFSSPLGRLLTTGAGTPPPPTRVAPGRARACGGLSAPPHGDTCHDVPLSSLVGASLLGRNLESTVLSRRFLSTASTAGGTSTGGAAVAVSAQNNKKAGSDDKTGNILLDYLGTIFLAGIGLIVLALVRSYKGGNNRNRKREEIEQQSALDPLEIDDLRLANPGLTLDVFRRVQTDLLRSSNDDNRMLYSDFVREVRTALRAIRNDDAFTVEMGHYLDRVVLDCMVRRGQDPTRDPQPLSFWMTVLSLALHAPVPDRLLALYEVAADASTSNADDVAPGTTGRVTVADTRSLVRHLQDTCQLTPDTQVVEDADAKYPIQQYQRGDVGALFEWEGSDDDALDIDAFASILKSRAVCVWGECYHKRRVV